MSKDPVYKIYPQIWPNLEDWPIYKLSEDRLAFIEEVNQYAYQNLKAKHGDNLETLLSKTIYLEKIRIKEEPWKADPPQETLFWKKLLSRLKDAYFSENRVQIEDDLLRIIVQRYTEEIVGNFKIKTFKFARKALTAFFHRLLNTAASRNFMRMFATKHRLYERMKVQGPIDKIRLLAQKGTLVVVPTHFSNLDSILIGYALDQVMGLPAFSYGAGLNLYNSEFFGYFMNRLGAYRVDRRKKNPIYLEVLKSMSTLSIERGVHSLFFPGGTRSRDGALEDRLKLGLMGTIIEAQREILKKDKQTKIFVIPLVLSYHSVLEANYLINQHLARIGKEKYLTAEDEFKSITNILNFAWKFFSASSDITLSFGNPIDIAGNDVDEKGNSFNEHGMPIEVKDYFVLNHELGVNEQREQVYTKLLGEKIGERFLKENIVLSSHAVAFGAFEVLKKQLKENDLFSVLRLPEEDFIFDMDLFNRYMSVLQKALIDAEQAGRLRLSRKIRGSVQELIEDGILNLGVFHAKKPIVINNHGQLISEDFKLLFYYHNRLTGYEMDIEVEERMKSNAVAAKNA
ncbi:MAG: 1-acyl-sn-glycerol-3-phosphate acyltransferase [Lewinellaceae bacterium]|nr:1-acyl-sn-glycerol-3-phosphate acyltransferase [Saprospiraceae bacterium]MCB9268720.1 1-acyl-sn-glycerol-3-phosphate acyltransferase [Lewinellaceae bacterium]